MTMLVLTAVQNPSEGRGAIWQRILHWVLEARNRKANEQIIEHLRCHPSSQFRLELERRLLGQ